eukprot:Ihof_evm10s113 gene=Ihof_evmTU10s113
MSKNSADLSANGSLILLPGESLLYSVGNIKFLCTLVHPVTVEGAIYVSSQRIVFVAARPKDLISFVMPLVCLHTMDLQQPLFGANTFTGKVDAMPNGGYMGSADFKLSFTLGGAIEFAQAVKGAYTIRLPSSGPTTMIPT